jgi:hypothetical protein
MLKAWPAKHNMVGDMVLRSRLWFPVLLRRWLSIGVVVALPSLALAQIDFSARKTPEQLFASDCSACHPLPQGLGRGRDARSLTGFLHEHYTTKAQYAAVIANYLVRVRDLPPPATVPAGTAEATKSNERGAKSPAEILRDKVRNYATGGEKAVPAE